MLLTQFHNNDQKNHFLHKVKCGICGIEIFEGSRPQWKKNAQLKCLIVKIVTS